MLIFSRKSSLIRHIYTITAMSLSKIVIYGEEKSFGDSQESIVFFKTLLYIYYYIFTRNIIANNVRIRRGQAVFDVSATEVSPCPSFSRRLNSW